MIRSGKRADVDDQEQGEALEEEMPGESVKKQRMNRILNIWSQCKMRENMALKQKRGSLARFGGKHMLRSGKRSLGQNQILADTFHVQ